MKKAIANFWGVFLSGTASLYIAIAVASASFNPADWGFFVQYAFGGGGVMSIMFGAINAAHN